MKARNIVFSCIVIAFLLGPVLLLACTTADIQVPLRATSAPAKYLAGGYEETNVYAEFNLRGIARKRFQDQVEKTLGNNIPFKANAILANASLQRGAIELSNSAFGYDCFPTFFSSERIRFGDDTVTYIPSKQDEELIDDWTAFAQGLADIASRNPDKRFVLYVVQGFQEPSYDPAYALVSSALHPSECLEAMTPVEAACPNVSILTQDYDDVDAFYENFFRTDHHWNIKGALHAYGQICEELDLPETDAGSLHEIPDYLYSGATARWGLDLVRERVFDCDESHENLTAHAPGGYTIPCDDHSAFYDAYVLMKPYAFYDTYYDNLPSGSVIEGGTGSKNALLIGNSFRAAIQRPLASSYRTLTSINQLHPETPLEKTLQEQIDESGADDIIIVANPSLLVIDEWYWS